MLFWHPDMKTETWKLMQPRDSISHLIAPESKSGIKLIQVGVSRWGVHCSENLLKRKWFFFCDWGDEQNKSRRRPKGTPPPKKKQPIPSRTTTKRLTIIFNRLGQASVRTDLHGLSNRTKSNKQEILYLKQNVQLLSPRVINKRFYIWSKTCSYYHQYSFRG